MSLSSLFLEVKCGKETGRVSLIPSPFLPTLAFLDLIKNFVFDLKFNYQKVISFYNTFTSSK